MEPAAIAHRRIAARSVAMYAISGLDEGEGRDDDPPDALDGIERENAFVSGDEAAHHIGLAARPERRAGTGAGFDRDQPVDDLAALHQDLVHARVDAID